MSQLLYLVRLTYRSTPTEPTQTIVPARHFDSLTGHLLADYIYETFHPDQPFCSAENGSFYHYSAPATPVEKPLSATRAHLIDYLRYATGDPAATITFTKL